MKTAFITHYCTHYRVRTYEILARDLDVDYYFYSQGDESYWLEEHGVRKGRFEYKYLPGFRIGKTRVTPTLPIELLRHNYDVYIKCINGRFVLPLTYLIARLQRKPFILWTGIWMRLQTAPHRLFYPLTRYFYRHADAVVTYGEHVNRFLVDEGVAPERIFATRHAVDNAMYQQKVSDEDKSLLRKRLGVSPDQKLILYVGRFVEEKGLVYLLDGFASLDRSDATLILVGTGPDASQLRDRARELDLEEKVRFVGYVPPEETVLYYSTAYVYAFPSVTTKLFKEPWGLVVNEAFNQGLPVIATDAVGAAAGGLVQDGINGFIVPERDSSALAQALTRVLDSQALRDRMGHKAREIIEDWDNEHMVEGFRKAVALASGDRSK